MSVITSATLRLLLTSAWIVVACGDTQVVVKPGDDATLQCQVPRDGSIEKLEWNKTDLKSEKYVFFLRDNCSNEDYQLDSFHGRVKLRDPQMKQGNASVVLKKVTASDSGPYECVVFTSRGGGRRKRAADTPFRQTVHLKVEDSGPEAGGSEERGSEERGSQEGGSQEGGSQEEGNLRGHPGLMGLMAVSVVIAVLGLIGFLVNKRPMKKNPEQPAADEQLQLSSTEPAEVQCQSEV